MVKRTDGVPPPPFPPAPPNPFRGAAPTSTARAAPAAVVEAQQPATSAVAHKARKPDMLVNGGALKLALNVLRRAGKHEVADELEATAQADSQPAPAVGYPPLPRVGAIGYASVVAIDSYAKTLTIGPHLPGVRDIALWTTDQMRAFADATHALRASHGQAQAAPQPSPASQGDAQIAPADVLLRTAIAETLYQQVRIEHDNRIGPWSAFDVREQQRIVDSIQGLCSVFAPASQGDSLDALEAARKYGAESWDDWLKNKVDTAIDAARATQEGN